MSAELGDLLKDSESVRAMDRKALVDQCAVWLTSGYADTSIKLIVQVAKPNYTEHWLRELITDARNQASAPVEKDRTYNIALHFQRYCHLISKTLKEKYKGTARNIEAQRNIAYLFVLDMMFNKERIMGMHKKSFMVKMTTRAKRQQQKKFDFTNEQLNNLTAEEQIEVLGYLTKSAIKDTDDVISVQRGEYVQEGDSDDIIVLDDIVETVQLIEVQQNDEYEVEDTGVVVIDEVPGELRDRAISLDVVLQRIDEADRSMSNRLIRDRKRATRVENKNKKSFGE
jgi:hypothetical protein